MFRFPRTDLHELNLDWILRKIKELEQKIKTESGAVTSVNGATGDVIIPIPSPSTINPKPLGVNPAIGIDPGFARGDHVHPLDATVLQIIDQSVSNWLYDNVDPSTGYVVDKSLTISDAAADAKTTGDKFFQIETAIFNDALISPSFTASVVAGQGYRRFYACNFQTGKAYKVTIKFSSYPSTDHGGNTRRFTLSTASTNSPGNVIDQFTGTVYTPSVGTEYVYTFVPTQDAPYLQFFSSSGAGTISATINVIRQGNPVCTSYPKITKLCEFTTNNQIQFCTMVGNMLWQSTSSYSGTPGKIFVFDPAIITPGSTISESDAGVTVKYHDIGHGGLKDYLEYSDLGLAYDTINGVVNAIFIKNLSTKSNLYLSDTDIITIPIGAGSYSFGPQWNMITSVTGTTLKHFLIGFGSNDLSVNVGGYGTFISGCGDTEFNGTVMEIEAITIDTSDLSRQQQGWFIYDGGAAQLNGVNDSRLDVFKKYGAKYDRSEIVNMTNYNESNGQTVDEEPEGWCVNGQKYYLTTWSSTPPHFNLYVVNPN